MWKGWKLCGSVVRMVFQNAGGKRNGLDLIIIFVRSPDSVIPWWRKLATPWIHTSSQFWRIPLIFPSTYHILGKEYSANPEKHIKMRLRDFSNHTTSPPHKNSWTFVYISLTFYKTLNTIHVTTPFAEKDLKRAFQPKYIVFMHLYDCWCISFLYRHKEYSNYKSVSRSLFVFCEFLLEAT